MIENKFLISVIFFFILISCTSPQEKTEAVSIIPKPVFINETEGVFVLDNKIALQTAPLFKGNSEYLSTFLKKGGIDIQKNGSRSKKIILRESEEIHKEGYAISIQADTIILSASHDAGMFYAFQTFRQLLPACFENGSCDQKQIQLRSLEIRDEPQFSYRGMHLDVGRHFFKVEEIKKYLDLMALLKMNTFHWHLTEDQGWRIEIKKYPKLTEIGSYRKETLLGHYNEQPQQFDNKRYGGFYSQEEVKEIVAYAAKLKITVIPEIEMPGHSQAAIAAYPELGCTGKQVEVATKWGVFDEIYCPTEYTFTFLENVLDEVMALFPSEYIHIGGDEAPKLRWKNCNYCQELIKKENLKDEHGLQSYFIKRIERYLNERGRKIIGWDEILEGGLAPNATVMSWRGIEGGIEAAKQKHKVVMTPTSHSYFDYYQSIREDEPLAIGGYLPLEKVYRYNPVPDELDNDEQSYIWGAQGNVWTEYMPDFKKVEYMVFPRAIALSEVVWSNPGAGGISDADYKDFLFRLAHFQDRLDKLDVHYAKHLYDIDGALKSNRNTPLYELKTQLDTHTIRYTLNPDDLNEKSKVYMTAIPLIEDTNITAAVFDGELRIGNVFKVKFHKHKAVGKSITINDMPHEAYNAGGIEALVNGISGSNLRFGDKEWLGFVGDQEYIKILIDFRTEQYLDEVSLRFFNAPGQWIHAPLNLSFELLDSNKDVIYKIDKVKEVSKEKLIPFSAKLEHKKARFLAINIKNYGIIPEGKQGATNPAWTFIDEIVVK